MKFKDWWPLEVKMNKNKEVKVDRQQVRVWAIKMQYMKRTDPLRYALKCETIVEKLMEDVLSGGRRTNEKILTV